MTAAPPVVLHDNGWTLRVAPEHVPAPPGAWLLDREHYRAHGGLVVEPRGRDSIAFVEHGGRQWVLRHYRRSGLPGRLVREHYLWTGLGRTRPWREFGILQTLTEAGLPVPRPVAAGVRRSGLSYTGALLMERLPEVRTLAEWLMQAPLPETVWHAIGALVARLHGLGVHHPDLNVTNLLLDDAHRLYVLDFDNAMRPSPAWLRAAGLRRLHRSFRKALRVRQPFHYDDARCWEWLMRGYHRQPGAD